MEASLKKTKFRYFKYEIKKNDYKQTVIISLKLCMRVGFLFMGDPEIKKLLIYCVTISQSSHIVNKYVYLFG